MRVVNAGNVYRRPIDLSAKGTPYGVAQFGYHLKNLLVLIYPKLHLNVITYLKLNSAMQ